MAANSSDKELPARLPEILGRLAWGEFALGPTTLLRHLEHITQQVESLARTGGGLLCIPYFEEAEPSARLLLSSLLGRLKSARQSSFLYLPQLQPDFDPAILSHKHLLIHNLPQCGALLDFLAERKAQGKRVERVVIATGVHGQWERLQSLLPQRFYQAFPINGQPTAEIVEQAVHQEQREYAEFAATLAAEEPRDAEIFRRAYMLVCLFDACGVPLPFALLARTLKADEDRLGELIAAAEERQLLHWIEVEQPPALLISSKSSVVARRMVGELLRAKPERQAKPEAGIENILDGCVKVITAINTEEKEERYIVLNFFQSWLRGASPWSDALEDKTTPRLSALLTLLKRISPSVESIWINGNEVEALLWGKVFEELRQFELSDKVFRYGLNQDPANIYLLRARARMLGLWSRTRPPGRAASYETVKSAFTKALSVASSAHVWQALGVMEAERGNVRDARDAFKRAASIATGEEKVYTLVAWANMELEAGNYAAAEGKLQQAGDPPFNPYVPHVWARLHYFEGWYDAAAESLKIMWQVDPLSVKGWNLAGEIAARRGHWPDAEAAFTRVLTIDDENIFSLRALGELCADRAKLAAGRRQPELATAQLAQAETHLTSALGLEPDNLQCQVSYGVILGQRSLFELGRGNAEAAKDFFGKAKAQLENVLGDYGDNKFALHGWGELLRRWQRTAEAEEIFERILNSDANSLPALLSLATLRVEARQLPEAQQRLQEVERILSSAQGREKALPKHDVIRAYNALADVKLRAAESLSEEGKEEAQRWLNQALGHVETAYMLDPDNAYTNRVRAKVFFKLNREAEAQRLTQRAEELGMSLES